MNTINNPTVWCSRRPRGSVRSWRRQQRPTTTWPSCSRSCSTWTRRETWVSTSTGNGPENSPEPRDWRENVVWCREEERREGWRGEKEGREVTRKTESVRIEEKEWERERKRREWREDHWWVLYLSLSVSSSLFSCLPDQVPKPPYSPTVVKRFGGYSEHDSNPQPCICLHQSNTSAITPWGPNLLARSLDVTLGTLQHNVHILCIHGLPL